MEVFDTISPDQYFMLASCRCCHASYSLLTGDSDAGVRYETRQSNLCFLFH